VHLKGAKEVSVATTGHDCDSDEDFVGFEWPHCTVCVQWMIFCVSRFILVFVTWNTCKSRISENEMKLWNNGFKLP
jgi:hypothetical protein